MKKTTRVVTCSCHVIDALVCRNFLFFFYKNSNTGSNWSCLESKISFVRVLDTVAALKLISISTDHCEPNKYA